MPDLRGFGWSDTPPGPIEPDVFVRNAPQRVNEVVQRFTASA
jgi:pimeloyl-ACP methyl ester carboxylesterase